MKNNNARASFKLAFFFWLIPLVMVKYAGAGDYYIYEDPNGKLVISNSAPPTGSNIIKKKTFSEDAEIVQSGAPDQKVGIDNRIASLERTIGELTENLRAQNEVIGNLQRGQGDTNIAVGVTQGPAILAKPPRQQFNRPTHLKNNLPTGPRGAIPAPPQHRPGAKTE